MTRHAPIADVNEGDILFPDSGFTCMAKNDPHVVKVQYFDESLAKALKDMLHAYDSDDGHGPIPVIEGAKQALLAASELYVDCRPHRKDAEPTQHFLAGQIDTIDGIEVYIGLSKTPWE